MEKESADHVFAELHSRLPHTSASAGVHIPWIVEIASRGPDWTRASPERLACSWSRWLTGSWKPRTFQEKHGKNMEKQHHICFVSHWHFQHWIHRKVCVESSNAWTAIHLALASWPLCWVDLLHSTANVMWNLWNTWLTKKSNVLPLRGLVLRIHGISPSSLSEKKGVPVKAWFQGWKLWRRPSTYRVKKHIMQVQPDREGTSALVQWPDALPPSEPKGVGVVI